MLIGELVVAVLHKGSHSGFKQTLDRGNAIYEPLVDSELKRRGGKVLSLDLAAYRIKNSNRSKRFSQVCFTLFRHELENPATYCCLLSKIVSCLTTWRVCQKGLYYRKLSVLELILDIFREQSRKIQMGINIYLLTRTALDHGTADLIQNIVSI